MKNQADIKPMNFPQGVVDAFTDGDCWVLAQVMGLEFGLPVVTATVKDDEVCWHHAAVRLPDGNILDIEGIWSENAWLSSWSYRIFTDVEDEVFYKAKEWTNEQWRAEIEDCAFDYVFPEESMASLDYAYELIKATYPQAIAA